MKKVGALFFGFALTFLLAGCGNNSDAIGDTSNNNVEAINDEKKKDDNEVESEKTKDEYVNGPLTEVGQKVQNEDGSVVELTKIISVEETTDMDPIEVTIKDIKLLKMSNIDEEEKEYLQIFVEKEITDPTNYVQITYIAENKTDENIGWNGMSHLVLSNGEQIKVSSNLFAEGADSDSEFYGKVKKESYIGIPFQGAPEEIENIKIVISSSFNLDNYKDITKEKQVTYEFVDEEKSQ